MPVIALVDVLEESEPSVGPKAARLARLARAGLPVPSAFVLPHDEPVDPEALARAAAALGGVAFAVRGSSTGRSRTLLQVSGRERLLEAVREIRRSGRDVAVIVQKMVPAKTSGRLFTRDPLDPQAERMLLEVRAGGMMAPEPATRLHLPRAAFSEPPEPAVPAKAARSLWSWGLETEASFARPVELDWAIAGDRVFILGARPAEIPRSEAERIMVEEVRRDLATRSGGEGGAWAASPLSDWIPEPTELTWSIVRGAYASDGGCTRALKSLGLDPAPVERIAGRLYTRMLGGRTAGAAPDWLRPWIEGSGRVQTSLHSLLVALRSGARRFRSARLLWARTRELLPELEIQALPVLEEHLRRDMEIEPRLQGKVDLARRIRKWIDHLAAESMVRELETRLACGMALARAVARADRHLREGAREYVVAMHAGLPPNPLTRMLEAMSRAASPDASPGAFLEAYGHRSDADWELAAPRWAEAPEGLGRRIELCRDLERRGGAAGSALEAAAAIPRSKRVALDEHIELSRRAHAVREMLGDLVARQIAHLRRLSLELGERTGVGDLIFHFDPEELEPLAREGGSACDHAERRRRDREAARGVALGPEISTSTSGSGVGRSAGASGQRFEGMPLASGFAKGPARVVREVREVPYLSGEEIVVLPSAPAALAPLVARARGAVFERADLFSPAVIAARHLGRPAVGGLHGLGGLVRSGETLTIDGGRGLLLRGSARSL